MSIVWSCNERQLTMHNGRQDNKRVNDLFARISRDLTPEPVRDAASVFYAPVSHDPGVTRQCASVLSLAELQRADRFVSEFDKAHFKQRRAFRRFCAATALGSSRPLSQVIFTETKTGRPYVAERPEYWFSFSSSRSGFLGAWSSAHGIGVDLEERTRNLDTVKIAQQFYADSEVSVVEKAGGMERLRVFCQLWSLKEAALKSIGEGLPFGLDAFEFELDPVPRVVNASPDHGKPEQFHAHEIEGINSCAAVVIHVSK